jgi:hypothetical protein
MQNANRAMHASSLWARLSAQLGFARFARFWRRVSPWSLLQNLDKLF